MNENKEPRPLGLDRVFAAARHLHQLGQQSRFRRPTLVAAIAVFGAGLVLSLRQLPAGLGLVEPYYLLLSALVAVPAAIVLNSIETKLSATLVGVHFGWLQATHIGLVASAANMLPLPGGPLVRMAALKGAGASLLQGGIATTVIAASWLGLAAGCAGAWLVAPHPTVGVPLLALGGIATAACAVALFRIGRSWSLVALVFMTKAAGIGVGLLRMYWALASLGLLVSFTQIWVFAVSDVAGAAVSIVPAGLGVNETVAALMAPLVAVPAAAAFLAVSLNRVIALPVLAGATALVAATRGTREKQDP